MDMAAAATVGSPNRRRRWAKDFRPGRIYACEEEGMAADYSNPITRGVGKIVLEVQVQVAYNSEILLSNSGAGGIERSRL